jgi:hypothetical protein
MWHAGMVLETPSFVCAKVVCSTEYLVRNFGRFWCVISYQYAGMMLKRPSFHDLMITILLGKRPWPDALLGYMP